VSNDLLLSLPLFLSPGFSLEKEVSAICRDATATIDDHLLTEIFDFRIYLQPDHAGAEFLRKFRGPNRKEQYNPEL
jgi:hypothetical protein